MNIGLVTTWFERGAAYVSKAYLNSLKTDNNVFIYARGGENMLRMILIGTKIMLLGVKELEWEQRYR